MILKEFLKQFSLNVRVCLVIDKNASKIKPLEPIDEFRGDVAKIFNEEIWLDKEIEFADIRKFNSHNVDESHPPFDDADLRVVLKE